MVPPRRGISARRPDRRGVLPAILRQRCPRCRSGRVFKGLMAMNETCPVCGLQFEREPGYFVGSMYLSYVLMVPLLGALTLLLRVLLRETPIETVVLVAGLLCLPCAPAIFRYARTLWLHLDRAIDRS